MKAAGVLAVGVVAYLGAGKDSRGGLKGMVSRCWRINGSTGLAHAGGLLGRCDPTRRRHRAGTARQMLFSYRCDLEPFS